MSLINSTNGRYRYKLYREVYERLGGYTTHFTPVIGVNSHYKKLFKKAEFKAKLAALEKCMTDEPDNPGNPDAWEALSWQIFNYKADLFLLEKLHPFYQYYETLGDEENET